MKRRRVRASRLALRVLGHLVQHGPVADWRAVARALTLPDRDAVAALAFLHGHYLVRWDLTPTATNLRATSTGISYLRARH